MIVKLLCIAFQSFIRPFISLEWEYPGCYRKAGLLFLEKPRPAARDGARQGSRKTKYKGV